MEFCRLCSSFPLANKPILSHKNPMPKPSAPENSKVMVLKARFSDLLKLSCLAKLHKLTQMKQLTIKFPNIMAEKTIIWCLVEICGNKFGVGGDVDDIAPDFGLIPDFGCLLSPLIPLCRSSDSGKTSCIMNSRRMIS